MDARQELGRCEGLDEIVVGSDLETRYAILNGVARREHQDHRVVARLAQSFGHLKTAQVWHEPIEHDHIRAMRRHLRQRLASVASGKDVKPLIRQRAMKHSEELLIVIHYKYCRHRLLAPGTGSPG